MRHLAALGPLALLLPHLALAQATSQSTAAPSSPDQPSAQTGAASTGAAAVPTTTLPQVNVIAPTPPLGSGVDRNTVPAQNQVLTSRDITLQGPPNYLGALQDQAQGVHLDSAAGNPFQPNLFYHGFQAAPLDRGRRSPPKRVCRRGCGARGRRTGR